MKKEDEFPEHVDSMKSVTTTMTIGQDDNASSFLLADLFANVTNDEKNNDSGSPQEDSSNFEAKALQSFFDDKDTMSVQTFDYDDEKNSRIIEKSDFRDIAEKINSTFGSIRNDSWLVLRKKLA